MPIQTRYLFSAAMDVDPTREGLFNEVYDGEHVPLLLKVPGGAARDREGLRGAVEAVRASAPGRVFLGGHSYGGRQASILAAGQPGLADALLLLSYPLHPPGRAGEPRTAHFPGLRTPALFVHGSADPFGALDELESARGLIPAQTALLPSEGAGP